MSDASRPNTHITGDVHGPVLSGTFHGPVHVGNVIYQHTRPAPVSQEQLAAAQELLNALPLEAVPAPSALPAGSRPIFTPNPLFTGRALDLQQLARALKGERTIAAIGQIAAATGLGGIGKTQLAVEFVHRYGCYFAGGVFWVSLASADDVKNQIAQCGGAAGLQLRADYDSLKLDEQVKLVLSEWQNPIPRLLVFDNCESEALLQQWRPPTGGARILVTSRNSEWDLTLGVQTLALGVLTRAESVELLRKFRPDLADPHALAGLVAIAEELGDLPLALHLAGSYLRRYNVPVADLLADLRRPDLLTHPSLTGMAVNISPTGHENHVARTFALSYLRLDPQNTTDALALQTLARAACFAPGVPIPRWLLKKTLGEDQPDVIAEEAIHRLAELGLLANSEDGALTLHRLLANFVVRTYPRFNSLEIVVKVFATETEIANETETPIHLRPWIRHLRHVADSAVRQEIDGAGLLFNNLGYYLFMEGDFAEAKIAFEKAIYIDETNLGSNHPNVAIRINNLGSALRRMGDYVAARAAFERALIIDQANFGPRHPTVATRLNNLGLVLEAVGDYAGAQSAYERAYEIDESEYGPNHQKLAIRASNLGGTLKLAGDYNHAQAFFERALNIDKQVFGPEHPNVANDLSNLGSVLIDGGDFAKARVVIEHAIAIWKNHLGSEHPNIGMAYINLSEALKGIDEYNEARVALEKALVILEKRLGVNHPTIASVYNNLGSVFYALGIANDAESAFARSLNIREETLGVQHPSTALSHWWLGKLARELGNIPKAQYHLECAFKIFKSTLGSDHSDTLAVRDELDNLFAN